MGGAGIWKSVNVETYVTDLAMIHLSLAILYEKLSDAAKHTAELIESTVD